MKKVPLLALILVTSATQAKTIKVLFLGNSYTNYNNLPKIIADLALADGDTVEYSSNTPGGHTLWDHYYNTTSLDLIKSKQWDYVVLQEQSQIPTIGAYKDEYFYGFADSLNRLIKENYACTKTVLYMTWGRKFGGKQCGGQFCSPDFVDFNHMQDSLEAAYLENANLIKAMVSPVGISWKNCIAENSNIELFNADNSHPSAWGSYLAACTFYATLFNKSPEGNTYNAFLPKADAAFLQKIAAEVVLTEPLDWNIGKFDKPEADFTASNQTEKAYTFTAPTITGATYYWNTGSGYTEGSEELNHTFNTGGEHEVCLVIVDSCGNADTACNEFSIKVGINNIYQNALNIYPNPASNSVFIELGQKGNLTVMDVSGKVIYTEDVEQNIKLDVSTWSKGIYFIQFQSSSGIYINKLIKD